MTHSHNFLAFDLGAESGRAMLGRLRDGRLDLSEVHRFANGPVRVPDRAGHVSLHWDVLHLWNEIQQGIALAGPRAAGRHRRGYLGRGLRPAEPSGPADRQPVSLPGRPDRWHAGRGVPPDAAERRSSTKPASSSSRLNSLYQLLAMTISAAPELAEAETFLPMPSLFSYWLSGRAVCEFSIATTTQCYNPRLDAWAGQLIEALGIPTGIFPDVVPAGTVLGPLQTALAGNWASVPSRSSRPPAMIPAPLWPQCQPPDKISPGSVPAPGR